MKFYVINFKNGALCRHGEFKNYSKAIEWAEQESNGQEFTIEEYENEKLYEQGYRKIPEGSVVLTKYEYSDYLILKNKYAHARERNERLQADIERLYKNLGKFKESVQKETAEKIFERFEYCPICGEKIDWEKIKEANKQ